MTDHAVETRKVVPDAPVWPRVRRHLTGWIFALPFLTIFAVFLAVPIVASFALSFTGFGLANLVSRPTVFKKPHKSLLHEVFDVLVPVPAAD